MGSLSTTIAETTIPTLIFVNLVIYFSNYIPWIDLMYLFSFPMVQHKTKGTANL